MAKLKSIFGDWADRLQLVIDSRNDRFAPLWYPQYFPMGPVQASLKYTTVLGASRIEAAASVVDRDGETPLRSRADLAKLSSEIPSIREMFWMKESDFREFFTLQAMPISDEAKKSQLIDMLYNDVKKVGNSVFKRIDIMVLEGLSTGKISLNTTNNPDGIVLMNDLDLLMPATNKKNAANTWDTAASSTVITDFEAVQQAGRDEGRSFAKVLMSPTLFGKFRKSKELLDSITAFHYGPKPGGSFNPIGVSTLGKINEYLAENGLPVVEIVDQTFGIEKDGKISTIRPFSDVNAVFIPAGNLGEIKNSVATEELVKVEKVSYAKFNQALISKWHDNEPLREWTKAELNAFPSFDAIDGVFHLKGVL